MIYVAIFVILALLVGHHAGHAHANYRHDRRPRAPRRQPVRPRGRPHATVPGPFGSRNGHRR